MVGQMHCQCVGCHKDIDPAFNFCPFCGADNRNPTVRPAVGPHNHEFRHGPFCTVCGEPYQMRDPAATGRRYLFRSSPISSSWQVMSALLLAILIVQYSMDIRAGRPLEPGSQRALLVCCGFVALGLITTLLCSRRVGVDLAAQCVQIVVQFGPFVTRKSYRIEDIQCVVNRSRLVQSRYGYRTVHDIDLMINGKSERIASSDHWGSHWEEGQEMALAINRPYKLDGISAYDRWCP